MSRTGGVARHAKAPDGSPLVQGKQVTGFSNSEEAAVGLTDVVPFLVEDELQKNGGNYSKGADWQSFSVYDGNLITGQPSFIRCGGKSRTCTINLRGNS